MNAPKIPQFADNASGDLMTILLVEDEEMLRLPVAKILRRRGFAVLEAGDGVTAINLFREEDLEIDVVFLDMTLPSMSGADVMMEIQRIRPNAKVIATSAYAKETVMDALGGQQPWAYVRKPYFSNELVLLLRAACSRRDRSLAAVDS